MQPEARLVKKIRTRIVNRGGRPIKIWGSDEGFQEVGISDLLVCYRGFFVALEVKVGNNEPSRVQQRFISTIRNSGGVAEVVYSVREVDAILDELDKRGVL